MQRDDFGAEEVSGSLSGAQYGAQEETAHVMDRDDTVYKEVNQRYGLQ